MFYVLLNNSIVHDRYWEQNTSLASQKLPYMFMKSNICYHYRVLQKSSNESYPETVHMEREGSPATSVNFHEMIER